MRQSWLLVFMLLFLVACSDQPLDVIDPVTQPNRGGEQEETNNVWMQAPLFDVETSEQVRVSDFAGEVVLVELFTTWCETCVEQQRIIDSLGVEHLSLNIDSDEDEQDVINHLAEQELSGLYAMASEEYQDDLIEAFGARVMNAPRTPVILVCSNQRAQLLPSGLKRAGELQEFIDTRC